MFTLKLPSSLTFAAEVIDDLVCFSFAKLHKSTDEIKKDTCWALECFLTAFDSLDTLSQEHILAIFINRKEKSIIKRKLVSGNESDVSFDMLDLERSLIEYETYELFLAHNHPNGIAYPSETDILSTEAIGIACNALGVKLSDHIIISDNSYYSFAEAKLL